MQHTLVCLTQYVHLTVIESHTSTFMQRVDGVSSVAALGRLHAAYISDMTAVLHVDTQSPLAALVEALLVTITSFAGAVNALPSFSTQWGGADSGQSVDDDEERVESWQSVRDLHCQFRSHAVLLYQVLQVAVGGHSGGGAAAGGQSVVDGVVQLQCAFDFNGYYSQRMRRELEGRVLA